MIFKLRKNKKNDEQTPASSTLKNKKTVMAMSLIAAFLIVITALYIFRADILMAAIPKEYAAYSLSKTIRQIDRETDKLSRELFGFEISRASDFTLKNSFKSDKVNTPFNDLKVSYAPSQSAMLINAEGIEIYGETVAANILWNNSIIGMHIPQLTDDRHFAVSSKNFGHQIMTTKLTAISDAVEDKGLNIEDADISFDNIMGENSRDEKEYKNLKKKITDAGIDLIKSGQIKSKGTEKITIDGKKKKAHTLTMDFSGKDVEAFLADITNIIENDETSPDILTSLADNLKNKIQNYDFDYTATVSLILKNDRVISADMEVKKHNIHISADFDGTKHMLGGFHFKTETPGTSFGITAAGNIIPVKDKADWNISITSNGKSSGADIKLDFKSEKAEVSLDTFKTKNIKLKGTCSGKSGFELNLNSKDTVLNFAVSEGAQIDDLPGSEYMILEKSVAAIGWELAPMALLNKTARGIIGGFTSQWLDKSQNQLK